MPALTRDAFAKESDVLFSAKLSFGVYGWTCTLPPPCAMSTNEYDDSGKLWQPITRLWFDGTPGSSGRSASIASHDKLAPMSSSRSESFGVQPVAGFR